MYNVVYSCTNIGVEGFVIEVEVDMSKGFPGMDIVGLPNNSVKEAVNRVRSAIINSDIKYVKQRYTVNLAPAELKKEGASFDLPIAIGVLLCSDVIMNKDLSKVVIIGELSLNGKVKAVSGILPMIYEAKKRGFKQCIVPKDNATEAALVQGISVYGMRDIGEIVRFLNGEIDYEATKLELERYFSSQAKDIRDYADVRGQYNVKRALEIAASGMHGALIIGSPGSGKTMMAKRLPSILPKLTLDESIEITKIYSVSGKVSKETPLITERPFRSPHHTISSIALTGGGSIPRPGEISLAHNGILFLDELPEFKKNALEILRQPLEEGEVTISRVSATTNYPSKFMLICSMNPCPCGHYPDYEKCTCSNYQIKKYLSKISGPLLDRIDIHVEAGKVTFDDLRSKKKEERSRDILIRVLKAHDIQKNRFRGTNYRYNSSMDTKAIEKYCLINDSSRRMLKFAFEKMGLSARAYTRVLKVARTIADLEGSQTILEKHIAESIKYRTLDRKYFER